MLPPRGVLALTGDEQQLDEPRNGVVREGVPPQINPTARKGRYKT